MLYIRIELWPGGDRGRAKLLHEGAIWNDGTGTSTVGNYRVQLCKKGRQLPLTADASVSALWTSASLKGFKRRRFGAWDLLGIALAACLGQRWKEALTREGYASEPGGWGLDEDA